MNCEFPPKENYDIHSDLTEKIQTIHARHTSNIILIADQPVKGPKIEGPDIATITQSINRVDATQKAAGILIATAKTEVRHILNCIIEDLANRARNCCRAGGLWKICLQPLVDKWYQWNEKWQIFGIPPDPAWD